MPLRVLVTHPGASLYGSDRMLLESLRGMVDAGMAPTLVVPCSGPVVEVAGGWGVPVHLASTPVLRKALLTPRGLLELAAGAWAQSWAGMKLLRRVRPDVVYVSTVTTPLWIVLARLARIPVVCHVHEAESRASALLQKVLALPLRWTDALVVNSHFALDVLVRSDPRLAARATVVPNGVDAPISVVPARSSVDGSARLLYLGRLSERKGVHVALDALELLVAQGLDARLDLVGDVFADHAAFAQRLHEQADRPALAGRVTFCGFEEDVWPRLAACDVLLVPSVLPEPFGNTAVEGILAARPVVASDLGGLPEAVRGYASARLVAPGDAAALAAGVRAALDALPGSVEEAVADARAAAQHYDPHRYRTAIVERLLEVSR